MSGGNVPIDINELNNTWIASSRTLFDNYSGINSSDLTELEIRNLIPFVFRKIADTSEELLYIKVHDAWELNSKQEPLFPYDITKAVIYIIRNPLEIAVSFAAHDNDDVKTIIKKMNDSNFGLCDRSSKLFNQLRQNLLTWSEHVVSWTEKANLPIHVLRYEDMLIDPIKTFSSSIDFLGLDYSKQEIELAIDNSNFDLIKQQEEKNGFREKPKNSKVFFRKATNDTWKSVLDKDDIQNIISNHNKVLDQWGYLTEIEHMININ